MHLILWLAEPISDITVVAKAMEQGVAVRAVSPMYSGINAKPGLILGLGGYTNEQMESAVKKLSAIIAAEAGERKLGDRRRPVKAAV